MAITETSICNSALIKVGGARITSLADTSKEGLLCNERYEKCRDELLRSHPWNFALKRASPAADGTAPTWGYTYRYAMPADCLRVFRMEDNGIEWKSEGRYILTDEPGPLNILYIAQITDTSKFDPMFAEALSLRLAADIAYAMTNSAAMQENMWNAYLKMVAQARSMDGQEGTPEAIEAESWLDSRN